MRIVCTGGSYGGTVSQAAAKSATATMAALRASREHILMPPYRHAPASDLLTSGAAIRDHAPWIVRCIQATPHPGRPQQAERTDGPRRNAGRACHPVRDARRGVPVDAPVLSMPSPPPGPHAMARTTIALLLGTTLLAPRNPGQQWQPELPTPVQWQALLYNPAVGRIVRLGPPAGSGPNVPFLAEYDGAAWQPRPSAHEPPRGACLATWAAGW